MSATSRRTSVAISRALLLDTIVAERCHPTIKAAAAATLAIAERPGAKRNHEELSLLAELLDQLLDMHRGQIAEAPKAEPAAEKQVIRRRRA